MGVLVMEVVDEDVVHAGVSREETGREEENMEEGDTVEAVDVGDSGYPNLSWLLTPVRNPRTRAEECYNKAHGRTRRIIERTFGLLKARFRCLHLTSSSLYYSPKVCQIIVACCVLHNLVLRRQVPFLQEDGPDGGLVAAVEPVDSEEEEAEEEDVDNRNNIIMQYFQ
ncbi:hypothetical protein NDU88_005931 [Pleurodeles waltl]|uniref:DDE Tnp4 domain-containing protein n=1 Tax=Pleurodeles waltl TaxID=8319 RepID=A0AAV7MXQ3_PLEWA|nr:hypothetical protein NDU88_005931 [Pleurodeles waltl]